jgi:hypothetical protein
MPLFMVAEAVAVPCEAAVMEDFVVAWEAIMVAAATATTTLARCVARPAIWPYAATVAS